MALYHRIETLTNTRGDVLSGYSVIAREPNGGARIPIYGDLNGTPIVATSGLANTAISNERGRFDYYIDPPSFYDEEVYDLIGNLLLVTKNITVGVGGGDDNAILTDFDGGLDGVDGNGDVFNGGIDGQS